MAWKLVEKLSPTTTCEVLAEAAKHLSQVQPPVTLLADSGVENVNDTVDQFLFGGILKRVLAQVEIVESNSIVESWWRNLKDSWLFINSLDGRAAVQRLVTFAGSGQLALTQARYRLGSLTEDANLVDRGPGDLAACSRSR